MNKKQLLMLGVTGALTVSIVATSYGVGIAKPRDGGRGMTIEFSQLDVDGDGSITQADLEAVSAERFSAVDTNGDGLLSVDEITARSLEGADERAQRMMERSNNDMTEEEILERMAERAANRAERMVERADANDDGFLSQEELSEGRRGGDRANWIERFDQDGDGAITEAEFDAAKERFAERRGERRGGDGPKRK